MILVLDVGNTHTHMGLFTVGRLRATWKLSTDLKRTDDEYAFLLRGILGEDISISGGIISSVVPPITTVLVRAVEKAVHVTPMVLGPKTEIGLINGYDHPSEVGMDRLANAVGANFFYGPPVLILDYGTAITLDYLAAPPTPDSKPIYKGGAILPGMRLAAQSLAQGTAKLPTVDLTEPRRVIGRTTVESIRSGLVIGFQGAIATLIERAREEIGDACRVISTGGDAMWFKDKLTMIDEIQPDLTLYGLRQIYGINNDCPLPTP